MNKLLEQAIRYRLLKILSDNPDLTQREIAQRMGISLGKTNYCISEFVKRGFVTMQRFGESRTKFRYLYTLTPSGIEEKGILAVRFLMRKLQEYEQIKQQIRDLGRDIQNDDLALPSATALSDLIEIAAGQSPEDCTNST